MPEISSNTIGIRKARLLQCCRAPIAQVVRLPLPAIRPRQGGRDSLQTGVQYSYPHLACPSQNSRSRIKRGMLQPQDAMSFSPLQRKNRAFIFFLFAGLHVVDAIMRGSKMTKVFNSRNCGLIHGHYMKVLTQKFIKRCGIMAEDQRLVIWRYARLKCLANHGCHCD